VHEDCVGLCGVGRGELMVRNARNKREQDGRFEWCETRLFSAHNDDLEMNESY
jgi:hypothetical protein